MKTMRALLLSLLIISYGLPMPVRADAPPDTIALPDGRVAEAYRADIEALLRDKYGLKIETGMQSSILQWFFVEGELPPGLVVRTDGTIAGMPQASRAQAYHFRVKVVDMATSQSEPLLLELNLRVMARQIRLTQISSPMLVPVGATTARTERDGQGAPEGDDDTATSGAQSADAMPSGQSRAPAPAPLSLPLVARRSHSVPNVAIPAQYISPQMADAPPELAPQEAQVDDTGTQASTGSGAMSNLFRRSPGGQTTLTINTPAQEIPNPIEVRNGTVVTVTGTQSPVNSCTVATKREELKPEPNPLAQFLKALVGLGAVGIASATNVDRFCAVDMTHTDPPPADVPDDPEARQIEAEIKNIRQSLFANIEDVSQTRLQYEGMARRVSLFISCKGPDGTTNICVPVTFDQQKDALKTDIAGLLKQELPVIESTELQLTTLKKVLADRYKRPGGAREAAWISAVNLRLDCFARSLASVNKNREFLMAARADLEKFKELLDAHQTKFTYTKTLIADANAKVTGTITCTNFFTKQPAGDPIPFTVTYQNLPRASVSAGVLFSLLDKRQVGTQPVRTGTAADGTPTFRLTFAETDRSKSQLVPFSFFNYYLSGTRKLNLNLSAGVGVNPNNGSNQAEYFFGGALGTNNIYVQLGGHVGRWQELGGGFVLGETVPDKFPTSVPITRRYSVRPAIGLSYKLPLP